MPSKSDALRRYTVVIERRSARARQSCREDDPFDAAQGDEGLKGPSCSELWSSGPGRCQMSAIAVPGKSRLPSDSSASSTNNTFASPRGAVLTPQRAGFYSPLTKPGCFSSSEGHRGRRPWRGGGIPSPVPGGIPATIMRGGCASQASSKHGGRSECHVTRARNLGLSLPRPPR
jgi:hypothetical protein